MSEPNRTTFIALVVLDDAIRRLQTAGSLKPPEHGVRLALAYLYSLCLSKNRDPFDSLWLTLLGRDRHPPDFRVTWAGTQFSRICQDIGVPHDINLIEALAKGRADPKPNPQRPAQLGTTYRTR
ncbi:hypothetical protein C8J26_2580 [Sphingomonas aurantiaca]|uniref:Uncharacterized protein n=1 Tax=Sphingomonas aurantiaca TaxID=185949 RepID=A0A2T5GK68_9SPHN|nr:hypothetical protein C8J26_2580 [Sphingomonas aurantiaca]